MPRLLSVFAPDLAEELGPVAADQATPAWRWPGRRGVGRLRLRPPFKAGEERRQLVCGRGQARPGRRGTAGVAVGAPARGALGRSRSATSEASKRFDFLSSRPSRARPAQVAGVGRRRGRGHRGPEQRVGRRRYARSARRSRRASPGCRRAGRGPARSPGGSSGRRRVPRGTPGRTPAPCPASAADRLHLRDVGELDLAELGEHLVDGAARALEVPASVALPARGSAIRTVPTASAATAVTSSGGQRRRPAVLCRRAQRASRTEPGSR